jgi:signal transduction histidine kinase
MSKWRPSLRSIIFVMLMIVLLLPLAGLFFFRIYENQLVRQTESELIVQSAVIGSVYAGEVRKAAIVSEALGPVAPVLPTNNERYHPIEATLDLTSSVIGPRRPDGVKPVQQVDPQLLAIGQSLVGLLTQTQDVTLAGFRLLDPHGVVIAGGDEVGLSLAHVDEVASALKGNFTSALRQRVSDEPPPPIYSVSRGTKVRVFTAFPVLVDGHVTGVIYASRTPSNIVKQLYAERKKLALAALSILAGTLLLGFLVSRTLTGPIRELTDRTRRIIAGDRDALHPLNHHGSREMAELSQGFLTMAQNLRDRSDEVSTFATHVSHELKSPLTAIQGAAELLRDSEMSEAQRTKFLNNIIGDTSRLTLLVRRLLDLARISNLRPQNGVTTLAQALAEINNQGVMKITIIGAESLPLAISAQNLGAILANLTDNAAHHGATSVSFEIGREGTMAQMTVADDGTGISHGNAPKIFDPFFTTRRDDGGTGMGLGIVRAMLEAHGGTISFVPDDSGAKFLLTLPLAG